MRKRFLPLESYSGLNLDLLKNPTIREMGAKIAELCDPLQTEKRLNV